MNAFWLLLSSVPAEYASFRLCDQVDKHAHYKEYADKK